MADPKKLQRTVAYYQLVEEGSRAAFDELDWNELLRRLGTKPVKHRIFEKEITGRVVAMELEERWLQATQPDWLKDPHMTWHDDAIYVLALSTDRDHVPNQRKNDGTLLPMTHDKDAVPATAAIVVFLPICNMFAVLLEDNTAVRPNYIGNWIQRILRDQNMLPKHNLLLATLPVVDRSVEEKLQRTSKLSQARIGGRVRGEKPSQARGILWGGPKLAGSFNFDIRVRPIKKDSHEHWEDDARRLHDWFEEMFGSLVGEEELTSARFTPAMTPDQDDLPHQELNLLEHRMTRKRQVQIESTNGGYPAISVLAAGRQIMEAVLLDIDHLQEQRT